MVEKILNLFYKSFLDKETHSLNQAALVLGFFAFLSQVLGFLRDRLLAHIFGASQELDIYYAAFRVPDFLFITVASVVSLSVLIPFIIERETTSDHGALKELIDSVFSFFLLLMGGVAILAWFLMPALSTTLFKGFDPAVLERVIFLSRILLLSPIVLGLSNLFGSLTQAFNRFTLYALSPLLYNAGIIGGIVFWGESWGILGVASGVILGAVLHAGIQVPFLFKHGLLPSFSRHFNFALIRRIVKISLPRTLTLSMSAFALIFLVAYASVMPTGSISILSLSFNLQSVPLSLIGISYSLAAFPTLTRQFQEKNLTAFLTQMQETARLIIFWSLPLTALIVVLRAQIVRVLLGSGFFDWPATRLTAAVLALFVLSSVCQSLILLFMRGFYSAGITHKPFFINLFSTLVLIITTYTLTHLFYGWDNFRYVVTSLLKVDDLPNSIVLMLPLGFSVGTLVNCVWLWFSFEKMFVGFSRGVARSLFNGISSALVLGAVSYASLNFFDNFLSLETLPSIFLQGFLAGLLGLLAGVLTLIALRSRELEQVWRALKGRFWRVPVIATDPEIV